MGERGDEEEKLTVNANNSSTFKKKTLVAVFLTNLCSGFVSACY
jgi:hypothetical protein